MTRKPKREMPHVPPSGAVAWVCTPTQKQLAENPLTVVTPVTVYAQSWYDARLEAAKVLGLPPERIHAKMLEL